MAKPLDFPPHLRDALSQPGARCEVFRVNHEAAVLVKVEAADIRSFRRPGVTVTYRYELARYHDGAAIRLHLEVKDRPGKLPYALESFLDPANPSDTALLWQLERQDHLDVYFVDMALNYGFAKRVPQDEDQRANVRTLYMLAQQHLANIPPDKRNFARVKARMQAERPM